MSDERGAPDLALHHDGSARYVRPVDGADPLRLRVGDRVRLRVRSAIDAPIERIFLRITPDGEQVFEELTAVPAGPAARWWEIDLRLSMPITAYRFLVLTEAGHRWLNGSGIHGATPTDIDDFRVLAGYDPPRWLADRVFYQIFPDRFANGDPTNDVADGAWTYRGRVARTRRWDELPVRDGGSLVEFYGGDLAGIEAHLDHLVDLGVNAIYLNPIFETRSNHGYDITDYGRVADHFGGDEALAALRRATRERDIRLLLDIAPNHVGVEHPWFQAAQADAVGVDRRLFRLPRAAGRLRVVAGRPVPAQARLPERGSPGGHVRGSRRRDAPLAAAAVRRGWLADRRGQHARAPGGRPARTGGRARDARRGQGRNRPMPTCSASIRTMPRRSSPATSGTGS